MFGTMDSAKPYHASMTQQTGEARLVEIEIIKQQKRQRLNQQLSFHRQGVPFIGKHVIVAAAVVVVVVVWSMQISHPSRDPIALIYWPVDYACSMRTFVFRV